VLDCGGYAVQYINVQMFSNLRGDFEDSLSKLSLVIFLSLLQLIKHVFSKLFQIVFFLTKCETENQNKMRIIGVYLFCPPLRAPARPNCVTSNNYLQ